MLRLRGGGPAEKIEVVIDEDVVLPLPTVLLLESLAQGALVGRLWCLALALVRALRLLLLLLLIIQVHVLFDLLGIIGGCSSAGFFASTLIAY